MRRKLFPKKSLLFFHPFGGGGGGAGGSGVAGDDGDAGGV